MFKVNIAPPQTAQLAAAQSEVGTDIHRQLEPRSCHFIQQNAQLLRRVEFRLALTLFRRRHRTHRIFRDVLLPLRCIQRVRQQIMMLDDRIRRQLLLAHQPSVILLNIARRQLLQPDFAELRLEVIFDHATVAVCGRLLDLRQDDVLVPVVKPLRECVLARQDLRPFVHLDLVLVERMGRVAFRIERPVLTDTLPLAVNAVVKAHAVLVAALCNAAVCHAPHPCGLTIPRNFAAVNGYKWLQHKIVFS